MGAESVEGWPCVGVLPGRHMRLRLRARLQGPARGATSHSPCALGWRAAASSVLRSAARNFDTPTCVLQGAGSSPSQAGLRGPAPNTSTGNGGRGWLMPRNSGSGYWSRRWGLARPQDRPQEGLAGSRPAALSRLAQGWPSADSQASRLTVRARTRSRVGQARTVCWPGRAEDLEPASRATRASQAERPWMTSRCVRLRTAAGCS